MSQYVEESVGLRSGGPATPEDRQMLIVSLLLCAPSTLQKAWLQSDDESQWAAALDESGSIIDRERALQLMRELSHRKPFFQGIGLLFEATSEYTGDPPHPPDDVARALFDRMR